jgi:anti-sigma factor RsiW
MNCSDFVTRFTDYLDGSVPADEVREMDEHLEGCDSCRRYKTVVEHGASVLRSLPAPELREDFAPRLQHRLYHVQEERVLPDHVASRAPALTVLGIAVVLTAVAWSPLLRSGDPVIELEPIVVDHAPPAPLRILPASMPGSASVPDLQGRLWDNTRLYEYSPLSRRYEDRMRPRQVGLEAGR